MIRFDEDTHKYYDGDKELISVTTMMAKQRLGADYSRVSQEVLAAAAERGKIIHKEIEEFCKTGQRGFTKECLLFLDYFIKENIEQVKSEFIVYNDICAGTVDLFFVTDKGEKIIADIKTTSVLHLDAVSWQLSIYNALNGYTADSALALHFADGKLKAVKIPLKPKEEIERLFECERNGDLFVQTEIATLDEMKMLAELQTTIETAKAVKEAAEQSVAKLKESIMSKMVEYGIKSYENDLLKITYIAPSERETIDTKALKREMPEIAQKYAKTSVIDAQVRITIRKEDKDE